MKITLLSVLTPSDSETSSYSMVWVRLRCVLKRCLEKLNESTYVDGRKL